jgi:hypothetical protein
MLFEERGGRRRAERTMPNKVPVQLFFANANASFYLLKISYRFRRSDCNYLTSTSRTNVFNREKTTSSGMETPTASVGLMRPLFHFPPACHVCHFHMRKPTGGESAGQACVGFGSVGPVL